jgi:hypothetical protein
MLKPPNKKFHVFFALGTGPALTYAYDVTWRAIISTIKKDPVRPKNKCPALVLNRFNDLNGTIRNRYILLNHTTGWFALDVDNIGKPINFVKHNLFDTIPELKVVWISSSGKGLKAIGYNIKLKDLTPVNYITTYKTICEEIRKRCGMRINFDQAVGRCHQPVFLNRDPNALVR